MYRIARAATISILLVACGGKTALHTIHGDLVDAASAEHVPHDAGARDTATDAPPPLEQPLDSEALCRVVASRCRSISAPIRCCGIYGAPYRADQMCTDLSNPLAACVAFRQEDLTIPPDWLPDGEDCDRAGATGVIACVERSENDGGVTVFRLAGEPFFWRSGRYSFSPRLLPCSDDLEQAVVNGPFCPAEK